jgi:hypothetical protein
MDTGLRQTVAMEVAFFAVLVVGCRTAEPFDAAQRGSVAKSIIAAWSLPSKMTAARLIEEYGPPDAVALGALGWKSKGRWKRIVLWDENESYAEEHGSAGNLQQTVAYRVPWARRQALAAFSGDVIVSPDGTELSARSNNEGLNYLALNLADEVGRGVRDPQGARRFYERTVDLAAGGKSSPYMQGFLFPAQP